MSLYAAAVTKASLAANTTLGAVYNPGSGMRRIKVEEILASCKSSPVDQEAEHHVRRTTTVGTIGTSVTPAPLDPAEAACAALAAQAHSVEPTYTAATELLKFGLNARSLFRWVAMKDIQRLIVPATANNGLGFLTNQISGAFDGVVTAHFDE